MKLKQSDYDWCYKKMKYWQSKMGMNNQRIYLDFQEDLGFKGQSASNWTGRTSQITLCSTYEWSSKKDIEMTIFHEVCECMLEEMYGEMDGAYVHHDIAQRIGHGIIRRLENLMFD